MPDAPPSSHVLFTYDLPTRWGDMDALGHVNNAVYFRYFEETRVQWLSAHRGVWTEAQGAVVAHAACSFKRPIVYPATLRIHLRVEAPRRSSIVTRYDVYRTDAPEVLCATGEATLVWIDFATGRPISLPTLFHELWAQAERDAA